MQCLWRKGGFHSPRTWCWSYRWVCCILFIMFTPTLLCFSPCLSFPKLLCSQNSSLGFAKTATCWYLERKREAEASTASAAEVGRTQASGDNQGELLPTGSESLLVKYLLRCCRQMRSLVAVSNAFCTSCFKEYYSGLSDPFSVNRSNFFQLPISCIKLFFGIKYLEVTTLLAKYPLQASFIQSREIFIGPSGFWSCSWRHCSMGHSNTAFHSASRKEHVPMLSSRWPGRKVPEMGLFPQSLNTQPSLWNPYIAL